MDDKLGEIQNKDVGKLGEDIAERFLQEKGFHVKTRNWGRKYGEIDIVAEKEGEMRFVEVKTVTRKTSPPQDSSQSPTSGSESTGYRPEDHVDQRKIRRMGRTAEAYLASQMSGEVDWHMDVVAIELDTDTREARVRHIENVF